MDRGTAFTILNDDSTRAARQALGDGLSRDEVANELMLLANAIRHPQDVAEDMSPIVRPS